MGKKTDDLQDSKISNIAKRSVRIAYTLNNYQPVRSTIISDQPFFYMDCDEAVFEDDLILDNGEFDAFERDLNALKRRVEAYERLSSRFIEDEDTVLEKFLESSDSIGSADDLDISEGLEETLSILETSKFGEELLKFARSKGFKIEVSNQEEFASTVFHAKTVLINAQLPVCEQVLLLARELRKVWQYEAGAGLDALSYQPDHAVIVSRAQIADSLSIMVRVAWELQLSGYHDGWARIENSPLNDLGRSFAREACLDFRSLNSGQANAACFETWFLSERCKVQDKRLIQNMLCDYQGYVFGQDYISRNVGTEFIYMLGSMPYGKNYLVDYASMILNDPIFNEVRDRSNANFLWFVKFEKSFREAEQELQTDEVIHKSRSAFSHFSDNKDNTYGHQESFLHFPEGIETADNANNVVYVQFSAGDV